MDGIPSARSPAKGRTPSRRATRIAALLALASALAAASGLLVPGASSTAAPDSSPAWKGYRVLLAEASADEYEILARLEDSGLGAAISESTEPVMVTDWSRPRKTTLAEARRSLLPGDPRLDAYIAGLGAWFEARVGGAAYRVFYVPAAGPGAADRIAQALSGSGIRFLLPESGAYRSLGTWGASASSIAAVAVMLAGTLVGSLLFRLPRDSRAGPRRGPSARALDSLFLRLLLSLPFAAVSLGGGWTALAAALWGLAAIDSADRVETLLDEIGRGAGGRRGLASLSGGWPPSVALAVSALVVALAAPSLLPSLLAASASSAAFAAAFSAIRSGRRRRFVPVHIGGRRSAPPNLAASIRASLACLAVLSAAASFALSGRDPAAVAAIGLSYPRPTAARGSVAPSPKEARELLASGPASKPIPGLASWLAHMALQEALPLMRLGDERVDPFASVSLPSHDGAAERISFDEAWAREAYRSIPSSSVEGLLASQGTARAIEASGGAMPGAGNPAPLAPMSGLLYILLLIPPLARIAAGLTLSRGIASRGIRQEA